ncbi:SOS response associated peptidase (SRAP) [Lutibacter agarilyticus]|uniref:Abasic site processing protein n=1 Tax=Lutibacter agarilyticus TaxID=1109740 RepID=A0A238WWL6_9FLAO|nr:SOS response-associated peptidase [Lutibacter agarilyticus]SNR50876.1 SOS response associated peptidase (SRAP) [Lutibacter agarilyticus]
MCFQTKIIKQKQEIKDRFNVAIDTINEYNPIEFCSAFDFPKTPIITNASPNKAQLFNWGLIPEWSQDNSIRNYTLNARIETLDEKKSFKNVIQNRCLILADGFYEWQWRNKTGSVKEKYLITLPNEELFAFAGIYSQWIDFNNEIVNSYSIITTQANELMSEIHNTKQRMPIILKKQDEQNWLQGDNYKDFSFPYSCDLVANSLKSNNGQLGLF